MHAHVRALLDACSVPASADDLRDARALANRIRGAAARAANQAAHVPTPVEPLFLGMQPVTLENAAVNRGDIRTFSHWFTWKIDGVHATLYQLVNLSSGGTNPVSRGPAAPRVLLVLRDGTARRLRVPGAVVITHKSSPVNVVLDGELALRRRITPTRAGYEAEHARTRAYEGVNVAECDARLYYVAADALLMKMSPVVDQALQARLTLARALLDGVGRGGASVLYNYDPVANKNPPPPAAQPPHRVPLLLSYKPHQAPLQAISVVRDVPPSFYGFGIDGIILTPAASPYVCGTNAKLFKYKPAAKQTIDLRAARLRSPAGGGRVCDLYGSMDNATEPAARGVAVPVELRAVLRNNDIVEVVVGAPPQAGAAAGAPAVTFKVVGARPDKSRPNAPATLENVLRAVLAPVDIEFVARVCSEAPY
jgi:hypothetical protein